MIESKHRSMRATRSLKNFLFIVAVVGCVFIVADQPVCESVDAILGVAVALGVGVLAGYLIGRAGRTSQYSSYTDALSMGFNQFSSDLFVKWGNHFNQSYATMDNMAQILPTQYLYFSSDAEHKVGSYISEPWGDSIKWNITTEIQNQIAGYIATECEILENVYVEMKTQDGAMRLDPSNDHAIRFYDGGGAVDERFSTTSANYRIRYAYVISGTFAENITYFSPKIIVQPFSDVYVQNLTTGDGWMISTEGSQEFYTFDFEPDDYAKRIHVIDGIASIYGVRTDFDSTRLKPTMLEDDTRLFAFNEVSDYIQDLDGATPFTDKIFPQDANPHMINYVNNASTVYGASVGTALVLYNQYIALGYSTPDDIPPEEVVPLPTWLFYDVNQMAEMNYTELSLMWYSFVNWLNETDFTPQIEPVNIGQANFTNAQLVLRANLTRWRTEYNSTGDPVNATAIPIWENRPILVVPLEESITFNVSDKKNITQNMLMMDAVTHEFLNLVVDKGARISRNVSDYEIEVSGITDHGEEVDNGTLDRTDIDTWVEGEYSDNPLFVFGGTGGLGTAYTYLMYAGIVAGAGVVLMILANVRPSLASLEVIGRLMLYGGMIGAVAIAIWYWVFPYLSDLWSSFTGWLPF